MTEPASRSVTVAVMAKAPVPGLAKTRLVPALSVVAAARLQRQFILRTLGTVAQAAPGPVQLWCAPSTEEPFFRALQRRCAVSCLPQGEGDIGQRMQAVFQAHAEGPQPGPLLLVGTDCPVMEPAHLREAAQQLLAGQDAVVIPAEDGGYVLIGLARPAPGLFAGVDWSTERVMAQTRQRARELGLRLGELPALWDVDRPEDLARWRALEARLNDSASLS